MKTTLEKTSRMVFNLILPPKLDKHWVSEALRNRLNVAAATWNKSRVMKLGSSMTTSQSMMLSLAMNI